MSPSSPSPNKWRCVRCKYLYFGPDLPTTCEVCHGCLFRPVVDVADLPAINPVRAGDGPSPDARAA